MKPQLKCVVAFCVFLSVFIAPTYSFCVQIGTGCIHHCKLVSGNSNQEHISHRLKLVNLCRTAGKTCVCHASPEIPSGSVPKDDQNEDVVEISVDELASLLQAAGMPGTEPKPIDKDDTKRLSSFLATPQAKTFMEAMAKQTLGGGGISGAMSAAAALPFLGKQDPGQPLRKSASQGDAVGVRSAINANIWVRLTLRVAIPLISPPASPPPRSEGLGVTAVPRCGQVDAAEFPSGVTALMLAAEVCARRAQPAGEYAGCTIRPRTARQLHSRREEWGGEQRGADPRDCGAARPAPSSRRRSLFP
jgi:hypothetical protein